jgi:hypothetical protein
VLHASSTSVGYAKGMVLTATVAAPQPGAEVDFYAGGGSAALLGTASAGDGTARLSVAAVTRTASYYAVLRAGGVTVGQSAPVVVLVAPYLSLKAERVVGPVHHFTVTVKPAVDGIPVVLQQRVGGRWRNVEKSLTEHGQVVWTEGVPGNTVSKWRVFVHGSKRFGQSTSNVVRAVDSRITAG